MSKIILWMSRHKPVSSQIKALQDIFGADVAVDLEPRPFDDAGQIVRRFREGGYSDIVVVAPLSVIAVMCEMGVKPLWSQGVKENDQSKIEYRGARGQGFKFTCFKRISRVELVLEEV